MVENICKRSKGQRINLQNMQAAHAAHTAQYQKNKQPNQKMGRGADIENGPEDTGRGMGKLG